MLPPDTVVPTDANRDLGRPISFEDLLTERIGETLNLWQLVLRDADLMHQISAATSVLVSAARRRSTIFFFGNGGSSADAGHLAAELLGRFRFDRPALPVVALADTTAAMTAIANDYGYDEVFSRQLRGLGRQGDVAVGLSTSGNSSNVIQAFHAASELGITTIGMTGAPGGDVADGADFAIRIPSSDTPHIQECHALIGHTMCEMVERELFRPL